MFELHMWNLLKGVKSCKQVSASTEGMEGTVGSILRWHFRVALPPLGVIQPPLSFFFFFSFFIFFNFYLEGNFVISGKKNEHMHVMCSFSIRFNALNKRHGLFAFKW